MKSLLAAAILLLVLAAPAHAVTSSITLNQSDPHLGGPATFTIVMPSKYGCTNGLCKSHVAIECSQAGVVVYSDFTTSDVAQTTGFVLGSDLGGSTSDWLAGPADCVATLSYVDHRVTVDLASTTFTATG